MRFCTLPACTYSPLLWKIRKGSAVVSSCPAGCEGVTGAHPHLQDQLDRCQHFSFREPAQSVHATQATVPWMYVSKMHPRGHCCSSENTERPSQRSVCSGGLTQPGIRRHRAHYHFQSVATYITAFTPMTQLELKWAWR